MKLKRLALCYACSVPPYSQFHSSGLMATCCNDGTAKIWELDKALYMPGEGMGRV